MSKRDFEPVPCICGATPEIDTCRGGQAINFDDVHLLRCPNCELWFGGHVSERGWAIEIWNDGQEELRAVSDTIAPREDV